MSIPDPIRRTAELITDEPAALERRLKSDIFDSIGRIKPDIVAGIDFDQDVMTGNYFEQLSPPLQGIAIARCEGALAFYNRIGWHSIFLTAGIEQCVPGEALDTLTNRYHAVTLHDLAYVHPKHFEKMMGKADAAKMWETLKQFSGDPDAFTATSQKTH